MTTPSHQAVMQQIRHNVLADLLARSAESEFLRSELRAFLALEPVRIDSDVYFQLARSESASLGLVRIETPTFLNDNPRPKLTSLKPGEVKNFARGWLRYVIVKILVRYLPRVISFEPQLKPLTVVRSGFLEKPQ